MEPSPDPAPPPRAPAKAAATVPSTDGDGGGAPATGFNSDGTAAVAGLPPDVKPPLSFYRAAGEYLGRRFAGIKFAWDEFDAPRVRKYDAGALSDASWLLSLTPGFSATIFARGGLHVQVLMYCAWVSLVYFQSRGHYPWGVMSKAFESGESFKSRSDDSIAF